MISFELPPTTRHPLAGLLVATAIFTAHVALADAPAEVGPPPDVSAPRETQVRWCQQCHGTPGFELNDPITGELRELFVDADRYLASSHGQLSCKRCHERGYRDIPHTYSGYYPRFLCVDCHDDDEVGSRFGLSAHKDELLDSVHGRALGTPLDCHTCHDPHAFAPIRRSSSALQRTQVSNQLCLDCHGAPAERPAGLDDLRDARTTHGLLPSVAVHFRKLRCVTCHVDADSKTRHGVRPAEASVRECTTCHRRESQLLAENFARGGTEPRKEDGVAQSAYVVGSTRSRWLDLISQVGFLLVCALTLLHASARWLGRRRTR